MGRHLERESALVFWECTWDIGVHSDHGHALGVWEGESTFRSYGALGSWGALGASVVTLIMGMYQVRFDAPSALP